MSRRQIRRLTDADVWDYLIPYDQMADEKKESEAGQKPLQWLKQRLMETKGLSEAEAVEEIKAQRERQVGRKRARVTGVGNLGDARDQGRGGVPR